MEERAPKAALGTVVDRDAVLRAGGAHVRIALVVPAAWAARGASVDVTAPALAPCARCEGGGCDGCGKSGAVRLEGDAPSRTFRLALPVAMPDRVTVRVPRPFGDSREIGLCVCDVRVGETAKGCALAAVSTEGIPSRSLRWIVPVAVALVAAVLAALASR